MIGQDSAKSAQFVWTEHPRRLNLGCGWDKREGYLNVDLHDFHDPDLIADVRNLEMLPSGEYDEVVAQDVLEHLERKDATIALDEWARVLRIGGTLVVRVPDLIGLFGMISSSDDPTHHAEIVHLLFGTQAYNGDFHLNGYTEPLLRKALYEAGFDTKTLTGLHGWLFDVVAERVEHPTPVDPTAYVHPNRREPDAVRAEPANGDTHEQSRLESIGASGRHPWSRFSPLALHTGDIDDRSRIPGGALAHRVVGRLLSRHMNAMNTQFITFQEAMSQEFADIELRLANLERFARQATEPTVN